MLLVQESFIIPQLQAKDSDEVIAAMAGRLCAGGAVCDEYAADTIAREQAHPTGLPTRPFAIAFPHADAVGVFESALSVANLVTPVKFKNMGDPDEELDVELVIMLANKSPEEQIETLRSLAAIFGQSEKLIELKALTEPGKVVNWLKGELNIS